MYNDVWGKGPRSWVVSRIFVLKITLQARLLLTVSNGKHWENTQSLAHRRGNRGGAGASPLMTK